MMATLALPARYYDVDRANRRASAIFVHLALIGCICLQRFAFYVAGSPVYFCLPIFLALIVWMVATGRAEFRPIPLAWFTLFAAIGLASALVAAYWPDLRILDTSPASLILVLALYCGLTIRPGPAFSADRTLAIFVFYARLCAVLGIAQYLVQFVGFQFFSFMLAIPALKPILVEPLFNYQPWVAYGSTTLRSNGFFLVEPSIFSQLLMLAVVVEYFVLRRWRFLPVYGVAYIFTYAGTGLLALWLACALYLLTLPRDAGRIVTFTIVAAVLAGIGSLVFPDQLASLTGRASELSYSGTSANARYMTQFGMIDAVAGETRTLIGYGPGALERAQFYVPGGSSPTLKLYIDYGILGLLAFWTFFTGAIWRRETAIVACFMLVNFQLGGGNLLFEPLIILTAIVCIWSSPARRTA